MKSTLHEAKLECHEKLKMVENSCKVLKDINSFQCPSDEKQLEEKVNFDMGSTDVSLFVWQAFFNKTDFSFWQRILLLIFECMKEVINFKSVSLLPLMKTIDRSFETRGVDL